MNYDQYIQNGFFAWTLTSHGYIDMTHNFWLHWKNANCSAPLCIICADQPSYTELTKKGIPCILMNNPIEDFGPNMLLFERQNADKIYKTKLKLLNIFAKDSKIQKCLYIDGDISIYKDIITDLEGLTGLWAQCDESVWNCSNCENRCTGLLFWTHSSDKDIFNIHDEQQWNKYPADQVWFNTKVRTHNIHVNILPRDKYPNGALLNNVDIFQLKNNAVCIHYNYRVGNSKKDDMKRFGDWLLPY